MNFTPKGAAVYCAIKNNLLPKREGGWDDTNFNKFWEDFEEALKKSGYAIVERREQEPQGSSCEIKEFINFKDIEDFYIKKIHKFQDKKSLISLSFVEKLMFIEIYKTLCTANDCVNDNTNNADNDSSD